MLKLESRLIRLRPLRPADLATTLSWRNDPAIRDNALGHRFPVTEVMERRWIDAALDGTDTSRAVFGIEDRADEKLVGYTQLNSIDSLARHARFGMLIGDADRHGRGLGRDALTLTLAFAFHTINLRRIHLQVVASNERALRLYERAGFLREGVLREHVFVDGAYRDLILMGLMRDAARTAQ